MSRKPSSPRRRYVRFTRWRRAHFFRVLEETGHAQMAAAAAGVSLGCIYRLRRVEAGFTEKMKAAVAEADRRLEESEEGRSGDGRLTVARSGQQALVVRRGIGGRLRVMAAGRRWWTERDDAVFFAHLRATNNVAASARAAGFTAKTAWDRRERLPSFAREMDEARNFADLALEFGLMALAVNGCDPQDWAERDQAMRTLSFRLNRRRGRHSPRRRRPPDIGAVAERIERGVRAVKWARGTKPRNADPSKEAPEG